MGTGTLPDLYLCLCERSLRLARLHADLRCSGGDVCGWKPEQCVYENGALSSAVCWIAVDWKDSFTPRLLAFHLCTHGKWISLLVVCSRFYCTVLGLIHIDTVSTKQFLKPARIVTQHLTLHSSIWMPDKPNRPDLWGPLAATQGDHRVPQCLICERWKAGYYINNSSCF